MMKVLSIAAVALMIAGSSAFACGCKKDGEKKDTKKTAYSETQSSEQYACNGEKKSGKKSCDKSA